MTLKETRMDSSKKDVSPINNNMDVKSRQFSDEPEKEFWSWLSEWNLQTMAELEDLNSMDSIEEIH